MKDKLFIKVLVTWLVLISYLNVFLIAFKIPSPNLYLNFVINVGLGITIFNLLVTSAMFIAITFSSDYSFQQRKGTGGKNATK